MSGTSPKFLVHKKLHARNKSVPSCFHKQNQYKILTAFFSSCALFLSKRIAHKYEFGIDAKNALLFLSEK